MKYFSDDPLQVGFALTIGGTTLTRQVKVLSRVARLLLFTKHLQGVGSEVIVDAVVSNTPVFVQSSTSSNGTLPYSLVLNNIQLIDVPTAVGVAGGATVLTGGNTTIASWAQGNVYSGTCGQKTWSQGNIVSASKPSSLLSSEGKIFGKSHPQYASYAPSQIISVKSQGAKGDGKTDDTRAIQRVFDQVRFISFEEIGPVLSTRLRHSTPVARSSSSMQVYTMSRTRSPFLQERILLAKPGPSFWRVEGTSNHRDTRVLSSEPVPLVPRVPWRSAIYSSAQPGRVKDAIG